MNPSYHESINTNLTRRADNGFLEPRAAQTQLNCGMENCKTGEYRYATQAESTLYDMGGYLGAPARTCQRLSCRATTGTYVRSPGHKHKPADLCANWGLQFCNVSNWLQRLQS